MRCKSSVANSKKNFNNKSNNHQIYLNSCQNNLHLFNNSWNQSGSNMTLILRTIISFNKLWNKDKVILTVTKFMVNLVKKDKILLEDYCKEITLFSITITGKYQSLPYGKVYSITYCFT